MKQVIEYIGSALALLAVMGTLFALMVFIDAMRI